MEIKILREKYRRILDSTDNYDRSESSSPVKPRFSFTKARVTTEHYENIPPN